MIKTFSKKPGNEINRVINCAICSSDDNKPHFEISGAMFVRCSSCGLVFQNPQPIESDLIERYDNEYFNYEIENEEPFFELMRKGLEDVGFGKYKDLARKLGPFMDIGCATGYLLWRFALEGWPVEGIEICKQSANFASSRGNFPVHTAPLGMLNLNADKYGAIHLSHVIEHLNEPARFCDEVYRILAPGGFFIITTPNISGFQSFVWNERWRSAIADHLYLFSKKTLIRMLEARGFKLLNLKTWGGLARGTVPGLLKNIADRVVKPLGLGDVMILIVQKPPVH